MSNNNVTESSTTAPFEEIELGPPDGITNPGFSHDESTQPEANHKKDVENGKLPSSSGRGRLASGKEEIRLIYTQVEQLPLRDFYHEVRPMLDVEHYIFDMKLILDLDKISVEAIIAELLQKMFPEKKLIQSGIIEDCKRMLFMDSQNMMLADVIQGTTGSDGSGTTDPNWLIAMCDMPMIKKTRICMARLKDVVNFGPDAASVKFICLIVGATEEKPTKNSVETGRTMATLLSDADLRYDLRSALNEEDFKEKIINKSMELNVPKPEEKDRVGPICIFGSDLWENIVRRSKCYLSDYKDGMDTMRTISKVLSTTVFLFFSIILPTVAFGALGSKNTDGMINENRAVVGQVIGGLIWAVVSGQPMLIIATTALVSLYSKVVYEMSLALEEDFYTVYAWVGVWSTVFIAIYAFTGIGNLVKFSTRSVEEIFTFFITICFVVDAIKDVAEVFYEKYGDFNFNETALHCNVADFNENDTSLWCNGPFPSDHSSMSCMGTNMNLTGVFFDCRILTLSRDGVSVNCNSSTGSSLECNHASITAEELDGKSTCLASFLFMILTVSTSVTVANFRSSPYLIPVIRETISDYALPVGVILWSIFACNSGVVLGSLGIEGFTSLTAANMQTSGKVIGVTFALGFAASILFFMDQNITSQILNAPTNKMKKGGAPHLDILMIGVVNLILSIYGLPWMHAVLPHSPLHVMCLADIEERVIDGQTRQVVVKARETRLTGIFCHVLMIIVLAAFPFVFNYIPYAVLDGLFLYCAVMSLRGNSFVERFLLLFTQQSQYPPTHYIRKCPQSLVHWFTFIEVIQLLVIVFIGFAPWSYVQMLFPLALAVLIPVRHLIIPYFIDPKFLPALESFE